MHRTAMGMQVFAIRRPSTNILICIIRKYNNVTLLYVQLKHSCLALSKRYDMQVFVITNSFYFGHFQSKISIRSAGRGRQCSSVPRVFVPELGDHRDGGTSGPPYTICW